MIELKCKCGNLVLKGNITTQIKKDGGTKKIFDTWVEPYSEGLSNYIKGSLFKFFPQGTILKNGSNNPMKWTC